MKKKVPVVLVRCPRYGDEVEDALRKAFELLGGLRNFIRKGQKVLLKPNMLSARRPEEAVTTHPQVLRALIRLLKAIGAELAVGDSPANVMKIEEVWDRTGFGAVCLEEGVPLLNFERSGARGFAKNGFSFAIARPVLEADVVINLPKVKTHLLTIFTGAVKNSYGSVPGFQKTTLHKDFPKPKQFSELLSEVYAAAKPHLNIADAVVGMEGDGPSGGRPVSLGFLAVSPDGVALDSILCDLLGIRRDVVPYFGPARTRGLGETDCRMIELRGDRMDGLRPRSFQVPGTLRGRLIPGLLARALGRYLWIRPSFATHCTACGRCVKACPMGAVGLEGGRAILKSGELCIGCCCCHEVCPSGAIQMKMSPLLSLLRGGRMP